MIDEDETVEIVRFGSGVEIIPTGIALAMARNRGAYLRGHIEVDEFEAELERLMLKRADVLAGRC